MKFSGVGLVLVLHPMVGLRIAAARTIALRVVADALRASVIASPCLARFV